MHIIRRLSSCAAAIGTAFSLSSTVGSAQQPIHLLGPDGNRAGQIEITLRSGESAGNALFYLHQDPAAAAMTVKLTAVLARGTLTFADESVELPAAGGQVPVSVSASNIEVGGVQVAQLLASTATGSTTIGRIVVRKATTLVIQGAGDDGIQLTHPVPEFSRIFRISSSAAQNVNDLRIVVNDFISEASVATAATTMVAGKVYEGSPVSVPAQGNFEFLVSAYLTASGTYSSAITLVYGGERVDVPLKVTRTNVAPAVTVEDLDPLRLSRTWRGGPARARVRISVRETGGRVQDLQPPAVVRLFATEGDRKPAVAGEWQWTVVDSTWSGPLQPYEQRTVEAVLSGLEEAGQLTARIRLADGTGGVIDKEVDLWVRESAWWAFLWILAGVLGSAVLRWWFQSRQQKLVDQYQIAQLRNAVQIILDSLPEPAPGGSRGVIQALFDHVHHAYELSTGPGAAEIGAQLTLISRKVELLPRWLDAAGAADSLGVRAKYGPQLDELSRVLANRATTEAELTAAETALNALQKSLDTESGLPIDELKRAINAYLGPASALPTAERRALEARDAELDQARTALDGGDAKTAESLVTGVLEWFGRFQLGVVRRLLADANPPPGVEADRWKALKSDLATRIDAAEQQQGDARVEAAENIVRNLLGELIPGLNKRMISKANACQQNDASLADEIRRLAERLDTASVRLADDEVGEAVAIYRDVAEKFTQDLGPRLGPGQMSRSGEQDPVRLAGPINAIAQKRGTRRLAPRPEVPSRRRLAWQYRMERGIVLAGLAIIAVVIGMNLLFVDQPSWGGWGDYLVALLWGLGVHSVGGAPFAGVQGLVKKYETAPQ